MYNLDFLIAVRIYCQFIRLTFEFAIVLIDIIYKYKNDLVKEQNLCLSLHTNYSVNSKALTTTIERVCNIPLL